MVGLSFIAIKFREKNNNLQLRGGQNCRVRAGQIFFAPHAVFEN